MDIGLKTTVRQLKRVTIIKSCEITQEHMFALFEEYVGKDGSVTQEVMEELV